MEIGKIYVSLIDMHGRRFIGDLCKCEKESCGYRNHHGFHTTNFPEKTFREATPLETLAYRNGLINISQIKEMEQEMFQIW